MTQKRILLVDDFPPILTAVAELLRDEFAIVGMVSDGPSALRAAQDLAPDMIITDISMPDMTGIDLAKELRLRGSEAKIIFLTVLDDSAVVAIAAAAGGSGYVLKARMGRDLLPAIRDSLSGRVFVSRLSG
jgi:DNA-binding NarL/FixJ family response regulator